MANKNLGFAVAAGAIGVGAKCADFPSAIAGLVSVAVFGVCMGVTNFLKVDGSTSPIVDEDFGAPTKQKKSKKSKKRAAAAEQAAEEQATKDAEKAEKKRLKERARKEAKKAEAAKAKADAEAAEATKTVAAAPAGEKKKKKKKKKKAAAPVVEEVAAVEEVAEEPEQNDWEEVKQKKGKKKVEEANSDSEEEAHSVAVYVERKYFAVIIGKQGSTLQAITGATGTKIELPKDGGIRTDILIEGSVEGCAAAKKAIKQLVSKGYSDITDPTKIDSAIAVPENKRAVLVGPGGRNIKLIQTKTGARINLPERGSDEKVTVVGDTEAVNAALKAIKQLVQSGFSDITHENYIQSEYEVSRDSLKTLIGPGGATIRGLQDSTSVRINIPSDKDGETVFVTLLGEPEGIADCRAQLAVLLAPPEPTPIAEEWTQQASLMHLDQW